MWPRFGKSGAIGWAIAAMAVCAAAQEPNLPEQPSPTGWRKFGTSPDDQPSSRPSPSTLVLPAGIWITVHVDQPLSSDRNQPGDVFTATLVQPLVVNGFVVARRGQTVGGRVADAQKAGRSKGTSRLGMELTEISLVDGQQLPVRTQLIEYSGGPSVGRDAAAIATTTGMGAAIGAAADGGYGAGIGALAGAAASTIGVLVTRGRATEVYPETALTFRTLEPLTISTEQSGQAFQAVKQDDYEARLQQRRSGQAQTVVHAPAYYGGYYPYWPSFYYGAGWGGGWWGAGWGWGWGPSVFVYSGPRYHGHHGHYRRW